MPNVGSYFQKTLNTISDYIPPIPYLGGGDNDDDDDDDEHDNKDKYTDDTTENMSIRRPKFKYTLRKTQIQTKFHEPLKTNGTQPKRKRWYDKFFFGSEKESLTTANPVEVTTEQSKFFNWFGLNKDFSTERSVPIPATPSTTQSLLFISFIFSTLKMFR